METNNLLHIEPFRLEREADKIVSELVNLGGAEWAICTMRQVPQFSNQRQELLRQKLRRRAKLLHKNLL